ncbi:MAG: A/G-specific adenine glycosylase [Schwartzia sp. (in: firmicutes)]
MSKKMPLGLKDKETFPAKTLAAIVAPLLLWFHAEKRSLPWRGDPKPYHVWVSEIMLQQTRVTAVLPYFTRFIDALPDVAALADAPEDVLLKLWEGLGYYSRVKNLQRAAQLIVREHGGVIPHEFSTLLTLPGIGRYTAGAISSIAYGAACPAVDGNVLRVLARLTASPLDIMKESTRREAEAAIAAILPKDAGAFNQALMELGALVCLPRGAARCDVCPLSRLCRANAEGTTANFPVKAQKKPRRIEARTVLRVEREGRIALHRRPAKGLLAGLWELPNFAGVLTRADVRRIARDVGWTIASLKSLPPANHIFTHVEWHLTGWHLTLAAEDDIAASQRHDMTLPPLHWVTMAEAAKRYGIPAAFHHYFPMKR